MRRSAGVIPVRRDAGGWRVLVLRCYANWDFPKGLVNPGETSLEAAVREAAEEAALDDLTFPWGDVWHETAPYGSPRKVARYHLAQTVRVDVVLPVNPDLGHPEHHEGRWVRVADVQALLPSRLHGVWGWAHGVLQRGD
jgi:8-oxo-dGTP pyrophosphatase MutT (NUDIX family)